jgi:hypothetical protein
VKLSIFSFSLAILFYGCEIPHGESKNNSDTLLCNIYDEEKREIIFCEDNISLTNLDLGMVERNQTITVWFLSDRERWAVEYANTILDINPIEITENGTSFILFTPLISGETILLLENGELNISMTVVEYI